NRSKSSLIEGGNDGVYATRRTGTVANAGTIEGTDGGGVYLKLGGSVTNSGTGSLIEGGKDGVYIGGAAGTVVNYGTISGATYSVQLSTTGSVLEVESGSSLIGKA